MKRLVKSLAVLFLLAVIVPPVSQFLAAQPGCAMAHAMDGGDSPSACHQSAEHSQQPCTDCCAGTCLAALRADTHGVDVSLATEALPSLTTLREDVPAAVDTRPPI